MALPLPDLVSVLIRSTRRPELAEALASVAAQTHGAIEVLVLDAAGGTEPGPAPEGFPWPLRWLCPGQRMQRSLAANALLEAAQGRWALFLDDDDWIGPGHVARLVAALQAEPQAVLAYAGVDCLEQDAEGQPRLVRRYDEPYDPVRLMAENYIPIHAALLDLQRIRQPGGPRFDPAFDLYEDWDFWLQCQPLGPFVRLPGTSAYYRIHGDSGAGVRLDQAQRGEAALEQLLAKWRQRWPTERLRELLGLARHVRPLQAQVATLEAELRDRNIELQQRVSAYEAQLANERDQARQTLNEALARLQAEFETSRSWRITRPLRAAGRLARAMGAGRVLWAMRNARAQLFRAALSAATRAYHAPGMAWAARLVPSQAKRRLRNALMRGSRSEPVEVQAGLRLHRPLGAEPLVSIVIPVYNHARYLEKCIRSALAQSWRNLEVVVVDDASPDPQVGRILERLAGEPRLKIARNASNQGICRTQNHALTLSSGAVIAFLDCDDYLHPEAISISMRHWRDDTVYLHTGRINVDEQDQEINRIHFVSLPRQDYFTENLNAMYATHLKMVRRDALARVGLFDPRFDSAQDYELLMRIAFHYPSSSFVHVPDFVYFHRLHGQQTTETQRARQDRLTRQIQDEARLRERIRNGQYQRFVSFIMLSYGKHSQTLRAIEGLAATVKIPHEVILYDNGSAPETVAFLRQHIDGKFPQVRVFYGDRNLGPAQGRRVAMEQARGEWIIVFDNDEIPEPGWLEELLLRAEANPDVGAVCCRVVFPDEKLQFSGGKVTELGNDMIDLALYDRGERYDNLASCVFREVDWCPIGATLFTRNIAPYLHEGYPNAFEDAGVSFALKKQGLKLLNAPGALVWHDHITFQPKAEMREQYMRDRYNPQLMLKSVASFYRENGLLIHDAYLWRENQLEGLTREQLEARLDQAAALETRFQ